MPLGLFTDTETSSLVVFERRSNDPVQPHIVQIAARLVDLDTGVEHASMNRIVQQVGWSCHRDALEVHGITRARSMEEGVPELQAIQEYFDLFLRCDIRLAYSEPYDRRVVRTAVQRFIDPLHPDGIDHPTVTPKVSKGQKPLPPTNHSLPGDYWNAALAQCVLQLCRKHVPAFSASGKPKAPTLVEAYAHLVGGPITGAHDAMGDVDLMIAVYRAVSVIEGRPFPELSKA